MRLIDSLKSWARHLKQEIRALYLASKHPDTPIYAKIMIALVVGYALSPIDLIPDFIPVLGFLDDLILLPLGIALTIKMIPPGVMAKCREQAQALHITQKTKVAVIVIVAIWLGLAAVFGYWVWGMSQA